MAARAERSLGANVDAERSLGANVDAERSLGANVDAERSVGADDRTDQPPGGRPGRGQLFALIAAGVLALPGIVVRVGGLHPAHAAAAVCFGLAVVAAAFALAWAAEVVQLDVSAGLALALVALIAVLPEYAVDFVFTWRAGQSAAARREFGPLALANMTGGNQLLIGVGWSLVVLLAVGRARVLRRRREHLAEDADESDVTPDAVVLERSHAVEIAFLVLATMYGLTLPLRRTLTLLDAAVLVAMFVAYIVRVAGAPAEPPHLVGPAALIGRLPTRMRRLAVAALFVLAAGIIVLCADHFASALVETGKEFGIDEFLLVKWLAPLASEAPELIVAGLFAWRLNANAGLGALVSSKVNQWTLLVGTLPVVFAISSGASHGLPLGALQREELFVTAAQSAFAVAALASRSMSRREAQWILGLFLVQFVLQGVLSGDLEQHVRIGVGVVYLIGAAILIVRDRRSLPALLHDGLRRPYSELAGDCSGTRVAA
jgi:cation:H+ antiporter